MSQTQQPTTTKLIGKDEYDGVLEYYARPASDAEAERDGLEYSTECKLTLLCTRLNAIHRSMCNIPDNRRLLDATALEELKSLIADLDGRKNRPGSAGRMERSEVCEKLEEIRAGSRHRRAEAWTKAQDQANGLPTEALPQVRLPEGELTVHDITVESAQQQFEALRIACFQPAARPDLFHQDGQFCRADVLRKVLDRLHAAMLIEASVTNGYCNADTAQLVKVLLQEVSFSDQHNKRVYREEVLDRLLDIDKLIEAPRARSALEAAGAQLAAGAELDWDSLLT